jgi:hypothetical protein
MIEELSDELRSATRPQEVLRTAGAWLGAALADQGFRWVPEKDRLRRERGRRIEEIEVNNAHGNRADRKLFAEFQMRIWVLDLGDPESMARTTPPWWRWRPSRAAPRRLGRRAGDVHARLASVPVGCAGCEPSGPGTGHSGVPSRCE